MNVIRDETNDTVTPPAEPEIVIQPPEKS
jgi:hypothetical protein